MNCELLPSVALNCQVTQIAFRFSTYILKVKKFDAGAEDDPQNVDRKVPSIASNNRNCPTIVLVGGWKLATIPPSSLGTVRKQPLSSLKQTKHIVLCNRPKKQFRIVLTISTIVTIWIFLTISTIFDNFGNADNFYKFDNL